MRVIQKQVKKQLVEFMDDGLLRRVWIPTDVKPTLRECRRGLEEGLEMDDLVSLFTGLKPKLVAKRVLSSLRRQGIWTWEDTKRPKAAMKIQVALWEGFGVRPGDLIKLLSQRR